MMDVHVYLFVGLVALVWTLLSVMPPRLWDEWMQIVFALFGAVWWGVWAILSGSVTTYSGGQEFTNEHATLLFLGGVLSLILFVVTAQKTIDALNQQRR